MNTGLHLVVAEKHRALLLGWKAIAWYAGKSVPTLQKWEKELGFPVRRTTSGSVIAVPREIDPWMNSQHIDTRGSYQSYLRALRRENRDLKAENRELLYQLWLLRGF
jgi:predicted DNA-binding transcriptional regulator AlpA